MHLNIYSTGSFPQTLGLLGDVGIILHESKYIHIVQAHDRTMSFKTHYFKMEQKASIMMNEKYI